MEESKNIFIYDKPVGRKQFFINILLILLILLLLIFVIVTIKVLYSINIITRPIIIGLFIITVLLSLYLHIVNYSKRICDIISDKRKALLYVILFWVGTNAMAFIPHLKYVGLILSIALLLFLLFKKGNMLKFETSKAETQVAVAEEENNNVEQAD